MNLNKIKLIALLAFAVGLTACMNELNRTPRYEISTEDVFKDPNNYINALAKLYGGLTLEGNDGGGGNVDISAFDNGASTYSRAWWILQQLPTDEAIVAWNDPGLRDMNTMNFTSLNPFVEITYNRIFFQIALINEFLRNSTEARMTERGFSDADKTKIRQFHAEARFLRALSYWHAVDLFGNVPLIKDDILPGTKVPPQQSNRQEIFSFVETELLAIIPELADPQADRTIYYARANKAVAWMVLAKLYLNAEVYTGTPRYADCINYLNQIINAGYALEPNYRHNFYADNHTSSEIIFALPYDGQRTRSYGGTTFLMNACIGGSGINTNDQWANGWSGVRTRREFVNKFLPDSIQDGRFIFLSTRNRNISNIQFFTQGWPTLKWKNRTRGDQPGSDPTRTFSDIDFPMFRLADAYLMYAECAVRGAGSIAQGVTYFNLLRERAFGNTSRNITAAELTLERIIDERARELYFEGHRRTDLIRFGLFTGGAYLWQFKGNIPDGQATSDHFRLYPLPLSDLAVNTNLVQNPGYN